MSVEPSGLTNATSMIWPFHPVVPKEVLAIRWAPGCTKRLKCPSAKYSALGVTVWPGPIVTIPVHVAQPPRCGPPLGSSAMLQLTTVWAQLRGEPISRLRACHLSVSENVLVGSADWLPEHSVSRISLFGNWL